MQKSLGFSPFELLRIWKKGTWTIAGPKEQWLAEDVSSNLLYQVANLCDQMTKAKELAKKNLEESQTAMKVWYNKRSRERGWCVRWLCYLFQGVHSKQGTAGRLLLTKY